MQAEYATTDSPPPYSTIEDNLHSLSIKGHSMVVLQPVNAWTAVARGAVLRGLEGSLVKERRSRYNYGTVCIMPFNAEIHPLKSRYWEAPVGEHYASDTLMWYLKNNDAVAETRIIPLTFVRTWNGHQFPNASRLNETEELYSNAETKAPVMLDREKTKRVCTIYCNFAGVPHKWFQRKTNPNGQFFWELTYELELRIHSAHMEFSLKVRDRSFGAATATFDDE